MIEIDGSFGEGGGQILRTSLALSLVTREPFRIVRIRAARKTRGLLRQHLTSVLAAAAVGDAEVSGATVGSQELTFTPRTLRGGAHSFDIGSAGSAMLVLQTMLLPLFFATEPSIVEIGGGTHNPASPSFDFFSRAYLPLLARMGAHVEATLERRGFYPAGGGKIVVSITPSRLGSLVLVERGALVSCRASAVVANLPVSIAQRELDVVARLLPTASLHAHPITNALGPGNVLTLEAAFEHVTEIVTGFGQRGVRAEEVVTRAVASLRAYLDSNAAVGEHLADQLLLPMALGRGGTFTTTQLTLHTTTNAEVIRRFLAVDVRFSEDAGRYRVEVTERR